MLISPMLASPVGANTVRTAVAASPVRANLRTIASAIESLFSLGSRAEARMMRGIRAVKACEAMTMARSRPCISKNERRQRRGNHCSSSTSGSRIRAPVLPGRRVPGTARARHVGMARRGVPPADRASLRDAGGGRLISGG